MNPPDYSRSLYFTPRPTPWGRLPQKDAAQRYIRASENKTPDPAPRYTQGHAGPEDLDELAERADLNKFAESTAQKRKMDTNNVPRSLQSQISPERAEEIRYAPQEFPKTQRMPKTPAEIEAELQLKPKQASPAAAGPGRRPSTPSAQQQMQKPSEADKTWQEKEPEQHWWETNPLKYKGWELIPGPNQLQLRKNF